MKHYTFWNVYFEVERDSSEALFDEALSTDKTHSIDSRYFTHFLQIKFISYIFFAAY